MDSKINYTNVYEEKLIQFIAPKSMPFLLRALLLGLISYLFAPYYYFKGQYYDPESKAKNLVDNYLKNNNQVNNQDKKIAIVTGGNTGIGYETVRWLLKANFQVVLACRSKERGEEAYSRLSKEMGSEISLEIESLDLTSLDSVREFSQLFKTKYKKCDVLINNAGVMQLPKFELTKDNYEVQFQVNYLAHFLLTLELKDCLESSNHPKVIYLSSLGHYMAEGFDISKFSDAESYNPLENYSRAKAAVVLSVNASKRKFSEKIKVYAVHPGIVATELFRHNPLVKVLGQNVVSMLISPFMKSPLLGAMTTLRIALDQEILGNSNYYADELPMLPLYWTLDKALQDKLWEFSVDAVQA